MAHNALVNHFIAFLGEFVGTFLFLFFAFGGTQTANQTTTGQAMSGPNLPQLMYISLVFSFSLMIAVWVFFRVSGGLFNPAVTLALCVVGVVPPVRAFVVVIAQIIAGIAAAAAVKGLIPGDEILFAVSLTRGTTVAQGFFLEMFFTVELVFTVLMLAAEKTKTTFVAPVGIGLALFVAELFGVYWTGGSLNPARAFGPAVIQKNFPGNHWVYWIGPIVGALLAAGIYKLLKVLRYEDVNGDQDLSADEERAMKMEKREKRAARHHKGLNGRHHGSQRSNHSARAANGTFRSSHQNMQHGSTPNPRMKDTVMPPRNSMEPPSQYRRSGEYRQDPYAQDRR